MVVHRRGRVRATAIERHELDPSQRQALLAGLLPAVIDAPRGGAAFPSWDAAQRAVDNRI